MGAKARMRLAAIGTVGPPDFPLDQDEISVGSASGNDLTIAGDGVSRRHATLARRSDEWRLTDLGSTNGTFVNGVRVADTIAVKPGDELRFGAARYALVAAPERRRGWVTPRRVALTVAILFALGFAGAEIKLRADREVASLDAEAPAPTRTARPTRAVEPGARPSPIAPQPAAEASAGPIAPPPVAAGVGGPWLDALNRYRAQAGLEPVVETDATSRADRAHARYLVKTYASAIKDGRNPGVAIHEEDTSSPWYSAAGAKAAGHSDIAEWPGPIEPPSPSWAIDLWIAGPFHRLPMLNPRLQNASYGDYCENGVCVVVLDVLGGMETAPVGVAMERPVEFPPDGATTNLEGETGEWPDPLSACPGYVEPTGLPITLQTAYFHPARLKSFSITPADGAPLEACGIDATSYVNPDPETERRGRKILATFGAIILIPRAPLHPGVYKVAITTDERDYAWSFNVAH